MEAQFLNDVERIIEENMSNEDFSVSFLAKEVGLSRSMLHRKLIRLTGKSATQLITEMRLSRARELIENKVATVSEIAYMVGFASPSYFNTVFKKKYGNSPGEVKKKGSGTERPRLSLRAKETRKVRMPRLWRIVGFLSIAVIVTLIILNIIQKSNAAKRKEVPEKSIAVLPFINDSPEQKRMYFINGIMEAILDNLSKIQDLRVVSRNSVEQYRNNPKPTPVVAEEMNVSYVLEGSGHRDGDNVRIVVQLLDGKKDRQLWSRTYEADIDEIFSILSEIAQKVASAIEVVITPEEIQLIEKVPTTNLTAHDFYQRGREEYWKYWIDNNDKEALNKAQGFYNKALEYDTGFAEAYTGLAQVCWDEHYWDFYFSNDYLDSVLVLTDKALKLDAQLSEAYTIRGSCLLETESDDQAIAEFKQSIKLNPNNWVAYQNLGWIYTDSDLVESIKNYLKAVSLERGKGLSTLLGNVAYSYWVAGFHDMSVSYSQQAMEFDQDSVGYYVVMADAKYVQNMNNEALEYALRAYALDSNSVNTTALLGGIYRLLYQPEKSLIYYKKWYEQLRIYTGRNIIWNYLRLGYAYWQNGDTVKAEKYFNEEIALCESEHKLNRPHARGLYTYFDLAAINAIKGEKEKAIENLKKFNQRNMMTSFVVASIKYDPMYDNLREEPEFQQIVREIEAKYEAEHERVGQWMEDNDIS